MQFRSTYWFYLKITLEEAKISFQIGLKRDKGQVGVGR